MINLVSDWKPKISVQHNEKFYSFRAFSGYGILFADPESNEILIDIKATYKNLGEALLGTLKQSRYLLRNYAYELSQLADVKYYEWIQDMMKRYNYKSKRVLFKNMKNCNITLNENLLIIRPTKHEKLEGWSGDGFTEDDYVKIPANSPPAEIGAALRLAFARCR